MKERSERSTPPREHYLHVDAAALKQQSERSTPPREHYLHVDAQCAQQRQELTRVWRGGREKCVEWVLKIRSFGGEMTLKYLRYCTVPCTVADAVVLAHDYMTGTIEDATFTTIIAFFEDCQMHHECLQGSEIFN